MKRHPPGAVNAYILNLMVHYDTLQMDEQEIRDRIESRFKQSRKKRIRPQNIRKFHLEPMVRRRWLREVDGKFERVGELKHVSPRQTLTGQFDGAGYYEAGEWIDLTEGEIDSFIHHFEEMREEDFLNTFTEKEYNNYMQKAHGD